MRMRTQFSSSTPPSSSTLSALEHIASEYQSLSFGEGRVMPAVKELQVNGVTWPANAEPTRSLLSVLRDDLGLTGAKYGCGEGRCGACTVLIDGHAVRSCNTRVGAAEGKKVQTV